MNFYEKFTIQLLFVNWIRAIALGLGLIYAGRATGLWVTNVIKFAGPIHLKKVLKHFLFEDYLLKLISLCRQFYQYMLKSIFYQISYPIHPP